ncbi:MAG: hypothetical protein J6B31_05440 [Bacteroidaceae bacterium]|nr:hypothetical protein [Bacteroidaceae bacterium]
MSKSSRYTIKDRLEQIQESIDVIKYDLPSMREAVKNILAEMGGDETKEML